MKNRLITLFVFLIFLISMCAQPVAPQPATPIKAGNSNVFVSKTTLPLTVKDAAREEMQDLTARVLKLEVDAVKSKAPKDDSGTVTAIIAGFAGLIAALIGGGMTLLGQHMTVKREQASAIQAATQQLELARKQAVFQQTEKILEFRIKQMEKFYAPMFALLKQSAALYNKMCDKLAEDDQARYKLLDQPDSEGYRLLVRVKDGGWKGFRLLDQMPAVKKSPKALALAAEIICIGKKTTTIISEHAGLASSELIELLGEYLAHYALLSAVYTGTETEPHDPPLGQKTGYFSHQLSKKIEGEYRELSKFLDEFETASKRMLADIGK